MPGGFCINCQKFKLLAWQFLVQYVCLMTTSQDCFLTPVHILIHMYVLYTPQGSSTHASKCCCYGLYQHTICLARKYFHSWQRRTRLHVMSTAVWNDNSHFSPSHSTCKLILHSHSLVGSNIYQELHEGMSISGDRVVTFVWFRSSDWAESKTHWSVWNSLNYWEAWEQSFKADEKLSFLFPLTRQKL